VELGIFSIVPEKFGFGAENGETIQSLTGKFPWRPNREFVLLYRELIAPKPGIFAKRTKTIIASAIER